MIITGYPGIGKSTLASIGGWRYIDLESEAFWKYEEIHGERTGKRTRPEEWIVYYGQIAIDLSKKGYIVFVSCHPQVRKWLSNHTTFKSDISIEKFYVIFPCVSLKDEWIKKLERRYKNSGSEKDKRALEHVREFYESDINGILRECSYGEEWYKNAAQLMGMHYDLKKIVYSFFEGDADE